MPLPDIRGGEVTAEIRDGLITATARVRRSGGSLRVSFWLPAWIAKEIYRETGGRPLLTGMWLGGVGDHPGYSFGKSTDEIEIELLPDPNAPNAQSKGHE